MLRTALGHDVTFLEEGRLKTYHFSLSNFSFFHSFIFSFLFYQLFLGIDDALEGEAFKYGMHQGLNTVVAEVADAALVGMSRQHSTHGLRR